MNIKTLLKASWLIVLMLPFVMVAEFTNRYAAARAKKSGVGNGGGHL